MTENANPARRGVMMAIAAPSGAGKSSVAHEVLKAEPEIFLSVSVTTRKPRPGEVDGKDYHFVSIERFKEMLDQGDFFEHAEVFGNFYGIPRRIVEEKLAAGLDVMFVIDWQGVRHVHEQSNGELVRIFLLPPSGPDLEKRLSGRGQDSAEIIAGRMSKAASEMSHWDEFDYVVVNDVFEKTVSDVRAIVVAERLRRTRQPGMGTFVEGLIASCGKYSAA